MTTVRTANGAKTTNANMPPKYQYCGPKWTVNGIVITMLHSTSDNSAHRHTDVMLG